MKNEALAWIAAALFALSLGLMHSRLAIIAADIKVIRSTSTNTCQHAITADTMDVDHRR